VVKRPKGPLEDRVVPKTSTDRPGFGDRLRRLLRQQADPASPCPNAELESLAQARESLRVTLASIGDAIIATDADGRITVLNRSAEVLTGWTETEALGRPLGQVFAFVNEDAVSAGHAAILRRRDGGEIPIDHSGAPIRTPEGAMTGLVFIFRDIAERRRDERQRQRLREADDRMADFLHNIHDGFLAVDRHWRLYYLNPRAAALLGCSGEGLLGKTLLEVLGVPPGSSEALELERARAEGVPIHFDLFHEPQRAWFNIRAYPHREGLALFLQDNTAQKRLEEQLRQAQKMEAIGRLAGAIAHDFNNLLTVMNGYAEMALAELPSDSPLREAVNEISDSGRRAGELTGGLLAFSRRQVLQFSVLDLNAVIGSMEKMLRRLLGEDVEVVTALSPGLWELYADRSQLEQVIMNLAVNARDAMPQGGTLTIETVNTCLDEDYARRHLGVKSGEYVLLAVSDTGCGMDAQTQARIFEPFFTTKSPGKGTGLGLATVYGIVRQTGGSISVYSEPGRGATFKIYVPRSSASVLEAHRAAEAAEAPRPADCPTILLVEDEENLRNFVSTMLDRSGFRVLTAACGNEALEVCRRENANVDVVLSDLVMPHMSGPQLAEEIKRLYPHMKFVFMSGYTEHAVMQQLMLHADAEFLSKPFTAAKLVSKLHAVLGTARHADPESAHHA
jgi:two-component system, cell cycle sensor histidine kinase and response regulator CckA